MTGSQLLLPTWPRVGASAAIFRQGHVLLGERGKGAMAGWWSLPGGHVEPGETVSVAAQREVMEETGIEARILGLVDLHEVIRHEATEPGADVAGAAVAASAPVPTVSWHYIIAVHFGIWVSGEPIAASDCRATRFVDLGRLDEVPLTPGAEAMIHRAHALFTAANRSP